MLIRRWKELAGSIVMLDGHPRSERDILQRFSETFRDNPSRIVSSAHGVTFLHIFFFRFLFFFLSLSASRLRFLDLLHLAVFTDTRIKSTACDLSKVEGWGDEDDALEQGPPKSCSWNRSDRRKQALFFRLLILRSVVVFVVLLDNILFSFFGCFPPQVYTHTHDFGLRVNSSVKDQYPARPRAREAPRCSFLLSFFYALFWIIVFAYLSALTWSTKLI